MNEVYKRIRKAIDQIRVIDTHEHLIQEKERTSRPADPLETLFSSYASSDLVSSGMTRDDLDKIRNTGIPLDNRWQILEPFWQNIQTTGYARVVNIAIRDLYGVNGLTKHTCKKLAIRMNEANKRGIYKWLLKDKSRIDLAILDLPRRTDVEPVSLATLRDVDRNYMVPVARFEDFILAKQRLDFEGISARCGIPIHSFSDFIHCLEAHFENASKWIIGVKIDIAYNRTLRFNKVSEREAEDIFTRIFNQTNVKTRTMRGVSEIYSPEGLSYVETLPLQDFILHKIIQLAIRKNLVIQIHTGLQEGNDNVVTNSDPTLLVNLFSEYKEARFDIFHGGYPFTRELGALAKNFPNVYVDMCWLHVISPYGAREALNEWLDTMPENKIFGFGGDYGFAEGTYGHAVIAKENISMALTKRVEDGIIKQDEAITLAKKLLRDNPYEFFNCKTLPSTIG